MRPDPGLDDLLGSTVSCSWLIPSALIGSSLSQNAPPSPARPHGISYSLTLHTGDGERRVGFDNAHAVSSGGGPARRRQAAHHHRHRLGTTRPYEYSDAATLLRDFWGAVDAMFKERGVLP